MTNTMTINSINTVSNTTFNNITSNFTKISNALMQNLSAIEFKIMCVIQQLVSIPGFILNKKVIRKMVGVSKNTFEKYWKMLKEKGYIKPSQHRINGKFACDYIINSEGKPCKTDIPTVSQDMVSPDVVGLIRDNVSNIYSNNVKNAESDDLRGNCINDVEVKDELKVQHEVKVTVKDTYNRSHNNRKERKAERERLNNAINMQIDKQLELDTLKEHEYKDILMQMADIVRKLAKRKSVKVSGIIINQTELQESISQLTKQHLIYTLDVYLSYKKTIFNPKAFITKVLLNAPDNMNAWYEKKAQIEQERQARQERERQEAERLFNNANKVREIAENKEQDNATTTPTVKDYRGGHDDFYLGMKKTPGANKFHNFDQREYDYDALLRQINGTANRQD